MDKLTTDHRFIGIDFPPNKFNFNEPLPPALRTAWRHEQMRETTAVASMMDRRSIDRDGQVASSAGAKQHGDEKMAVKELNFFAIDDRSKGERAAPGAVKSEIAEDCAVEDAEVHPETGLNLLTENIGSERSIAVAEEEQEVQEDAATGSNKQQRHLTSTELIAKSNLSVLKAELDKMNMENQQLKSMLCQVNTNYYALQMHFQTLMQRHVATTGAQLDSEEVIRSVPEDREILEGVVAVNSLHMEMSKPKRARKGENSQSSLSEDRSMLGCSVSPQNNIVESMEHWTSAPTVTSPTQVISNNLNNPKRSDDEFVDRRLLMRGDSSWTPHRAQKHGFSDGGDRAAAAQSMSMIRKARVSVRARSEAATIADGCQWRKYGQKIAKGNPCPRGYYRCSMSVACPVRKQVQRCVEDRTVLITTYEGQHNHPLPEAAMAMASTTSSAASMLLSGSMPSSDGIIGGNSQYTARTSFPNCPPTLATLSTTAPFPTITLDLTQTTPPNIANPMQLQRPIMPLNQVQLLQLLSNQTQAPVGDASKDARTAAIVGDPNFAAALLTAITSIIGDGRADNAGGAGDRDHVVGDKDDNSHDV